MKKTLMTLVALLVLVPAILLAAPQPYVPQSGDLSGKDQPSAATVRQVQNRAENFKPMPHRPSNTPVRPPQEQRFQPRPYVPDPADGGGDRPQTTTPLQNAGASSVQPGSPASSTPEDPSVTSSPEVKPTPVVAPTAVASGDGKGEITSVMNKALSTFAAHDCPGLLKFFHAQAYVLVRTPWGEQGSLGHQQLKEAYCADVSSGKAPKLTLDSSQVEMLSTDRGKVWGKMTAEWLNQGLTVKTPASFEADLVKESGQWLITDAIIQYDLP